MDNKPSTDPTVTTWSDVPQAEIDKELNYWQSKRRAHSVWLVPCRYSDGEPTCSGSPEFPYSNIQRRHYVLDSHWRQSL